MGHIDAVVTDLRHLRQQLAEPPLQVLSPGQRAVERLALQPLDHLRGRARAHVGVDQDLFEPLPGLVVERAAERRAQLAAERLARLGKVLAQAAEEPALLLLGLGRLGRRSGAVGGDEHVLPGLGHGGRL